MNAKKDNTNKHNNYRRSRHDDKPIVDFLLSCPAKVEIPSAGDNICSHGKKLRPQK